MVRYALFWLMLAFAVPALAVPTGPGAYKIGGVSVDVVAGNSTDARANAYREAERRAWPLLWARLTGGEPAAAPKLADGAIEGMVAGVEIEVEHFSLTRYIGRLAIVFDRDRASGYLGGAFASAPPPMLLLPVTIEGGTRMLYQTKTAWVAAWLRFRDAASALDYVIPAASAGDNVVLTAYQSRRGDRTLWRNILSRFKAADVLTAELWLTRSYPGGPVAATVIARHGPDSAELGRASLRAANTAGVDAMLDDAVRQVDAIYVRALQAGLLRTEKGLTVELEPLIGTAPFIGAPAAEASVGGTEANVITPDAKAWAAIETAVRGTPTVTGVGLISLSLGGTSRIVIRHSDTPEMLAYQLDQRGFRLAPDGAGVLLRRKVPGDPVVSAPLSAAELNSAEVVAEPDAAPVAKPDATKAIAPAKPAVAKPDLPAKPAASPPKPRRDPLAPN
ncbi:DUF2066 domain-containing protein [Polymorphobacter sp. PAMC 29334]|uniref:DUF2066 domain-containing protein n=1 Tax=Polymorphobacter sp. PAMC 29334 TaxID=2862331 RepID=UPI001C74938B|nr:DUF2066 domain-containing protein [Polymorphobacter sp. PAMC 29334]QYE34303.1 DUF2066 domain-containing protein [Polymorphobacter sp. PAMC 29334]